MNRITQILILMATLGILSCSCEDETTPKIECPCLDKEEMPPYFKSCEEMGEDEGRWECMVSALLREVYMQVRYPETAIEECVEGTVVVAIIMDEGGNVLKTETRNDPKLGHGLEEAALNVINLLNENWCPGLINCEPVESEYVMPIKFKLAK